MGIFGRKEKRKEPAWKWAKKATGMGKKRKSGRKGRATKTTQGMMDRATESPVPERMGKNREKRKYNTMVLNLEGLRAYLDTPLVLNHSIIQRERRTR